MEIDEVEAKTTSISKGCFLFKPATDDSKKNATPRKRRKKSTKNEALQPVDFFQTFPKEKKSERTQRYQHFLDCWTKFENKIEEVQSELNTQIFTDLLQYMENAKIKSQTKDSERSFNTEIPTAVLVTGVNLPDHSTVFAQFVCQLKEETTPFAVRLQSKECSNLKSMIKNTFDRTYKCAHEDNISEQSTIKTESEKEQDDDESEDDDQPRVNKRTKSNFSEYTFIEFKTWYLQEVKNQSFAPEGITPPLVLIFEDFERFTPAVLQDFILICSEHSKDIPMIFVLGVATTVSAVHTTLPHSVAARLSIEKFQAQPSLVCLTHVVDKVLMNNINAFKLGPSIFRLLYEHFLYHDFSVKNFIRALKFCIMEHFNNSPFNVMCVEDEDFICDYVTNLDPVLLKEFKKIKSLAGFIDKKSKSEQTKLANNTTYAKDTILKLIDDLNTHESCFYPMVKCFHVLTARLPGYPLGKRLRDTYEYCVCSPRLTKEKKYETSMGLLRLLSRVELQESLMRCIEIINEAIENGKCDEFEEDLKTLRDFLSKFEDLDRPHQEEENNAEKKSTLNTPKTPTVYKNRFDFQEQLKMAVKEKRKQNPYEKLRSEIVDALDKILKKYLYSPMFLPLHELFYYDDMETVRKRMNGTPRVGIQKALTDPYTYLQCSCCKDTASEIYDCQPDICILYKLHMECGKLINLYDWLQAYITVIDPTLTDSQKKKSKAKQQKEDQLQARFIRGVSELQFLGFIKSTKRKTDHVARLTWGSC